MNDDLLRVESHFAFGQNWAEYARLLNEDRIRQAEIDLTRIAGDLRGCSFLDIGCGSGVHSAAAARLGATVLAVDLDPDSVATAMAVTQRFAPGCEVRRASVFDLAGQYDVVYSWGVLHHTGAMWQAIGHAAGLVAPGGRLAIALYARSPLCPFWRIEKRFYTASPKPVQSVVRGAYKSLYVAGLLATGRNPVRYIRNYASNRGMDWHHDVHDWLGGYPYESARPQEVAEFLSARGFTQTKQVINGAPVGGLLGSGCDEYLFTKAA